MRKIPKNKELLEKRKLFSDKYRPFSLLSEKPKFSKQPLIIKNNNKKLLKELKKKFQKF